MACPRSGPRAIATRRARPSTRSPRGCSTVEHGAKGGDEVNRPEAGKNYGWPVITYGVDYSGEKIGVGTEAPGYEQPLFYWDPSIAPSGLAVYEGEMFPEWKGDLLVGSLKFELLSRLDRDASGTIGKESRCSKANSAASATSRSRRTARSGC